MNPLAQQFLGRRREGSYRLGDETVTLRLLSARQALQIRQLAEGQSDLWCDAALLAHCLYREQTPLFPDTEAVLQTLSVAQIQELAEEYARFEEENNPSLRREAELTELKDSLAACSEERLKWHVLQRFHALPSEERAKEMTEGDYLYCLLHEWLDYEQMLRRLCPSCRTKAMRPHCPACGAQQGSAEQNAGFDMERFRTMQEGAQ